MRSRSGWLNRTVLGTGLTSGLGDLCYETAQAVSPAFLALLGAPPALVGSIEGLADGLNSFTKLAVGYLGDRLGARKALAVFGYALTPLGGALIALAAAWPMILIGRLIGWFGKGIRGPMRDAILAGAVEPEYRGRALPLWCSPWAAITRRYLPACSSFRVRMWRFKRRWSRPLPLRCCPSRFAALDTVRLGPSTDWVSSFPAVWSDGFGRSFHPLRPSPWHPA